MTRTMTRVHHSEDTYERTVVARRHHYCDACYLTGMYRIKPGETYVRAVAFPGTDVNGGTTPWVMRICLGCFRQYDPGKQLP